jgi:hypothetical protein
MCTAIVVLILYLPVVIVGHGRGVGGLKMRSMERMEMTEATIVCWNQQQTVKTTPPLALVVAPVPMGVATARPVAAQPQSKFPSPQA